MTIVLLACAGLVVDGGGALNARMKLWPTRSSRLPAPAPR